MSAFHSLIERLAIGNVYQMPAAVERRSRGKLLPAFLCSNERARHGLDELGHGPALPSGLTLQSGHHGRVNAQRRLECCRPVMKHGLSLSDGSTTISGIGTIDNAERSETLKAVSMTGADRETSNRGTTADITDYRSAGYETASGPDDLLSVQSRLVAVRCHKQPTRRILVQLPRQYREPVRETARGKSRQDAGDDERSSRAIPLPPAVWLFGSGHLTGHNSFATSEAD